MEKPKIEEKPASFHMIKEINFMLLNYINGLTSKIQEKAGHVFKTFTTVAVRSDSSEGAS